MSVGISADAKALTEAQRKALIDAVDCLDGFAGEGIFIAGSPDPGDVLYDIFNAFFPDWDGHGEYPAVLRNYLEQNNDR